MTTDTPTDAPSDLVTMIRALRVREGRTQQQMADALAATAEGLTCSKQHVWAMESGRKRPSVDMLNAYAVACGADRGVLLRLAAEAG